MLFFAEAQAAGRPEGGRGAQNDRLSEASTKGETSLNSLDTPFLECSASAAERDPQPAMLPDTGDDAQYSRFMTRVQQYQDTLLVRAVSSTDL